MLKKLYESLICLFLFVFTMLTSSAQRVPEQFRFEQITVDQGLSHSDAMCVVQDKEGFIWVGTNKGINRYDGYEIRRYDLSLDDQTGISANRIRSMHVASSGALWVGVERAGLFWYDALHDRFLPIAQMPGANQLPEIVNFLSSTNVMSIVSDKHNRLWVGTQRHGVIVLQLDGQQKITGANRIRLGINASDPPISKIVKDNIGNIWIGTLANGLWFYKNQSIHLSKQGARQVRFLGTRDIRALHADRHGDLWIGAENQILRASKSELEAAEKIAPKALTLTFALIENLFVDSLHRLWISTRHGLLLASSINPTESDAPINQQNIRTFLPMDSDPYSINSVRVHEVLEDSFNNLWFATSAGGLNLLNLRSKPFGHLRRHVTEKSTPADNYINAIYHNQADNKLWIGTRNGFASYNPQTETYQNYLNRELSGSTNGTDVSCIYKASDGTLWIGTRYGGLFTMKSDGSSPLKRIAASSDFAPWYSISIESIVEDKQGTIWIASFNAGIYSYNKNGTFIRGYNSHDKLLPTVQFTSLCYDSQENILWAATRDVGLLKMQTDGRQLKLIQQFSHEPGNPNSLKTNYTWPLLLDKQSNLWIGTIGGGLHKLEKEQSGIQIIKRYSPWISETDIESLLQDRDGNIWIGGAGLYQFNPETKRVFYYDVSDGLQSNSFKIGAAYAADNGKLYFGGTNGITYFDPKLVKPNSLPPVVQFTEFRILNQVVGIGDTLNGRVLLQKPLSDLQDIHIQPKENDFSIEFTGLNFVNPSKQQYAYKLEGYNRDWIKTTAGQRMATFANLPAGSYTFLVKASNDDGIWSAKPASLHIIVAPPWWKTWWAYLLYTLLAMTAFAIYRRIEMAKQSLKSKLALETFRVEQEKEMTDSKLRFFTNISHELRSPLTLILGPMEELVSEGHDNQNTSREKMMLVHKQTHKLLELVNQLMEFRKLESGHVSLRAQKSKAVCFIEEVFLIFKLKAQELHIDYAIQKPDIDPEVYFDQNKLEIILVNLLSNAFKFTPEGGKIRVCISIAGTAGQDALFEAEAPLDNFLQITVRDWGIGMQPGDEQKIFDPYYQASETETLRMVGTGIGLSLVKQFVLAHHGNITVESKPSEGSIFTIRLPFGRKHLSDEQIIEKQVQSELPAQELIPDLNKAQLQQLESDPTQLNASRLLIVEDSEEVRNYLVDLFSSSFTVLTAVDGIDGWEKTQETVPDIVVSDVMMPRSDGLELCQKIKQNPKTQHIQVLLLTARSTAANELEGIQIGADEYMAKPFNPNLLYAKVVVMLRERRRLKEYYQKQLLMQPTDIVIPNSDRELLEKAMSIVESNLANPEFNVQFLVREMGMSQSTFYRHIKSITGQSVVEFIRDIRIKRAAQLLAATTHRVSEVANLVGFEDIKHFRKTFQELYEISPSEYIRQHRQS
jgi:signal transduction histidine kinase/ligand-binding sensor domain-containing protein/DNA-binding response OmpR family regulator